MLHRDCQLISVLSVNAAHWPSTRMAHSLIEILSFGSRATAAQAPKACVVVSSVCNFSPQVSTPAQAQAKTNRRKIMADDNRPTTESTMFNAQLLLGAKEASFKHLFSRWYVETADGAVAESSMHVGCLHLGHTSQVGNKETAAKTPSVGKPPFFVAHVV